MKITNKANLPEAIVKAVQNDPYSRGDCDYSVTQLLRPARMVALERIHRDSLEEDAADRLWALMGQLGHLLLERAGIGLVERRLFATRTSPLDTSRVLRISGQLDLVDNRSKSVDYKFTSAYSIKNGEPKPEWIQQLNLGRWLAWQNGIGVDALEIVAIYRDWSVLEARRNSDYPQRQAQVFRLPVWTEEQTQEFLDARLKAHESAKQQLPECCPEERWEKPAKWAVMKEGRKSAVRVFDNEHDALSHQIELGAKHTVQHRPGECVRCANYCPVSRFCEQWKAIQQQPQEEAA